MYAIIGSLTVDFDVVDVDGSGVDVPLCSIAGEGPLDMVPVQLEQIPGLVLALQKALKEAGERGVVVGPCVPVQLKV